MEDIAGRDGLEVWAEVGVEFQVRPVRFWGDEERHKAGFCRAVDLEKKGGWELGRYPFAC